MSLDVPRARLAMNELICLAIHIFIFHAPRLPASSSSVTAPSSSRLDIYSLILLSSIPLRLLRRFSVSVSCLFFTSQSPFSSSSLFQAPANPPPYSERKPSRSNPSYIARGRAVHVLISHLSGPASSAFSSSSSSSSSTISVSVSLSLLLPILKPDYPTPQSLHSKLQHSCYRHQLPSFRPFFFLFFTFFRSLGLS